MPAPGWPRPSAPLPNCSTGGAVASALEHAHRGRWRTAATMTRARRAGRMRREERPPEAVAGNASESAGGCNVLDQAGTRAAELWRPAAIRRPMTWKAEAQPGNPGRAARVLTEAEAGAAARLGCACDALSAAGSGIARRLRTTERDAERAASGCAKTRASREARTPRPRPRLPARARHPRETEATPRGAAEPQARSRMRPCQV